MAWSIAPIARLVSPFALHAPAGRGRSGHLALVVALLITPAHLATASAAGAAGAGTCTRQAVPVSVPALPGTYEITGLLCLPPGPPPGTGRSTRYSAP